MEELRTAVREDVIVGVNRRARPGRNTEYFPGGGIQPTRRALSSARLGLRRPRASREDAYGQVQRIQQLRADNRPERLARAERAKQQGKS